ncbi:MAG: GNAT family N-acetyltransferase [Deltaproteobacteria bacterium]|nr:GNAT family N-acetyltransferase [Deltaproteobacteria bacterium]
METVEIIKTTEDAKELDELLWLVLWKPLGLPRGIRKDFVVDGEEIEIAAMQDGHIIGGIVGVRTSPNETELRHLAVHPEAQRNGKGRRLVEELVRICTASGCKRIHTIARNTSAGFFRKAGFQAAHGQPPEHPIFLKHGITFELMEKT